MDALIAALRVHKSEHNKERYYVVRSLDRNGLHALSSVERAARMIYLIRTCFNRLWRVNSRGEFNVRRGSYRNPTILDENRLTWASEALASVHIQNAAFQHAVVNAHIGDFVYFDPPYVPVSPRASFASYAFGDFGERDQQELADVFRELDQRGCNLMLSNSDMPLVHELYAGFNIRKVRTARRINSNGQKRGHASEVLLTNYL